MIFFLQLKWISNKNSQTLGKIQISCRFVQWLWCAKLVHKSGINSRIFWLCMLLIKFKIEFNVDFGLEEKETLTKRTCATLGANPSIFNWYDSASDSELIVV